MKEAHMYPYEKTYDHVVTVDLDHESHIATVTLDSPENLNRFSEQLIDELSAAIDQIRVDREIRVVILHGTGPVSFGPGDLSVLKSKFAVSLPAGRQVMTEIGELIRAMMFMPQPVIGVAEGQCLGGGCNLLLSTDLVIAQESAVFHELFVNYSMSPDTGGLWALQRLVGPMRAKQLAMLAEPISAAAAKEYGMVLDVVPDGSAMEAAHDLAVRIAAKSPVGVAHTKAISNHMEDYTLQTYFQVEADYLCLGALSSDFRETNIAAAQHREPEFTGE